MTKKMDGKRSFKVINSTFGIGTDRNVASDPERAGKNGGKAVFRKMEKDPALAAKFKNANHVIVHIVETTQSSKNSRDYFYKVTRTPKAAEQMEHGKSKFVAKYVWDVEHVDANRVNLPRISSSKQRGGFGLNDQFNFPSFQLQQNDD